MSSAYSLIVHSANDVQWKPGASHAKKPSLYVAVFQNDFKIQKTHTVKRTLAPKWEHLLKISSDGSPSSAINLRLFHDSSLGPDICIGAVDVTLVKLMELCSSDAGIAKLGLVGVAGSSKGKPVGALAIRLTGEGDAAASALEKAKREVNHLELGLTSSAILKTAGIVTTAAPAANGLESALSMITSKLDLIVRIGDEVATIHPYIHIAWKVLTSVHQAVKKQRDVDEKLCKLVQSMSDTYSFVEDIEFLAEKIKSLEEKCLAIAKQTVECALFIQEYTANGFCGRAVCNIWTNTETKIDDLIAAFLRLKCSFDSSLSVQAVFVSTKMMGRLEGLDQSDALKKLNPADMNASSRPVCLAGTRREILDYITTWLTVPTNSEGILWVTGVAGLGKSTISTTVAESFRAVDRLGAFLFFDRSDRARSHPDAVIRTLAYSLALSNPHIGSAISAAIHRDPSVVNAPIQTQFRALLLEPLQAVEHSIQGPIIIILDALDECGDPDSRIALLSVLSDEFPKIPSLFRFLITSRAEKDITEQFRSRFDRKELDVSSSTGDIELFLRHEMARMAVAKGFGPIWPGEQCIQDLVKLSGGLFIWASTATKFIAGFQPATRLKIVLAEDSSPQFNLDKLYAVALQESGPWNEDTGFAQAACAVLACIVLGQSPMTAETIDSFLFVQKTAAEVLSHLGCVIQWSPGTYAQTLHASLADYLTNPKRSGGRPWSIDSKIHHSTLSFACLRVLNSELRFNICGLENSHVLNVDVPDLSERVAARISPQLSYSSCFWFKHIQHGLSGETLLDSMSDFFYTRFLYWLEVLSLLGQTSMASSALPVAAENVRGREQKLQDFIADTIKFVSAFAPLTSQSAPHVYLSALAFTPQESRVRKQFSAQFPRMLQFNGELGTCWPSIEKELHGHKHAVTSVCFSPDGGRIVSGSVDHTLRVWDTHTGALIVGPLDGHTKSVYSVHFSPDGSQIVSGSEDCTVCVWNARTGALVVGPLQTHSDDVRSVNFSPDGTRIVSGSRDNTLCIWDARSGLLVVGPLKGHTDYVSSVHFSPDGTHIVSGSHDKTIRLWDVETGALVASPLQGHTDSIESVHFSPDGARIASGGWDQMVRVWDAQTGALLLGPLEGHTSFVESVCFSPDGTKIASGGRARSIHLWDASTGAQIGALNGHTASVLSVHFSPDGERLVSGSGSDENTVRIWNVQSGLLSNVPRHDSWVESLDFSRDGRRIGVGTADKKVLVWDAYTGALLAGPFEGHSATVTSVNFSPDGAWIASGSHDWTVRIWDAQTGAIITRPVRHPNKVTSVNFSPDGGRIASGSCDGKIRVYNAHTGILVIEFLATENVMNIVNSVHFSPDGTCIASGGYEPIVRIFDAQTGALVRQLEGHIHFVNSVKFSPNGEWIASGSHDRTVRVWDTQTGDLVAGPLEGHTYIVASVHFSPDGRWIASGSWDSTVRIWDVKTGALVVGPLEGHTENIRSVQFSPTGTHIASGGGDRTARIWAIRPGAVPGLLLGNASGDPSAHVSPKELKISEINASVPYNPLGDSPTFDLETGWVLNAGSRMFWVPPWLREGLYFPRNTLVIRNRGTTKLDLTQFVHGTEWEKCIDPSFRSKK